MPIAIKPSRGLIGFCILDSPSGRSVANLSAPSLFVIITNLNQLQLVAKTFDVLFFNYYKNQLPARNRTPQKDSIRLAVDLHIQKKEPRIFAELLQKSAVRILAY
ncbi:hypothetical protein [Fibrobacter sp. HC4]|uniref:hypothetical protein n=1 Tax=Fibrobacter sp. HC4 TaxID=3239812 RepID=UPI002019D00F|nr:hypothetical protein [Fibrobacter succinogenes]